MKRVMLEPGGDAPCVLDDADLEQAVRSAVVRHLMHQGQVCMDTNRIIAEAKVYDEFADRFTAHVKGLKRGDANHPAVSTGPIIGPASDKAEV